MQALLVQGATATQSIRLDNYSSQHSSGALVQHSKPFDPANSAGAIPDAFVDLRMHRIDGHDGIKIRVTNLVTQESVERLLVAKAFGFQGKISDSILFVRRSGVDEMDEDNMIDNFNYGAAPGITYGGTFLPRGSKFWRFMQPGVGVNMSLLDFDDGQMSRNDIEIGMGVQVSLMDNVLQFTPGSNLQAETHRRFFAVGLSLVNQTTRLQDLVAQ